MNLLARLGSSGRARLSVSLRYAQVATDRVLANLIDHDLFRHMRARHIEEDRLIDVAVLFFVALIFHRVNHVHAAALFIYALKFYGHVTDLLWLIFAGYREFHVVALAHAAEYVDFVMVAGNQGSQFA